MNLCALPREVSGDDLCSLGCHHHNGGIRLFRKIKRARLEFQQLARLAPRPLGIDTDVQPLGFHALRRAFQGPQGAHGILAVNGIVARAAQVRTDQRKLEIRLLGNIDQIPLAGLLQNHHRVKIRAVIADQNHRFVRQLQTRYPNTDAQEDHQPVRGQPDDEPAEATRALPFFAARQERNGCKQKDEVKRRCKDVSERDHAEQPPRRKRRNSDHQSDRCADRQEQQDQVQHLMPPSESFPTLRRSPTLPRCEPCIRSRSAPARRRSGAPRDGRTSPSFHAPSSPRPFRCA